MAMIAYSGAPGAVSEYKGAAAAARKHWFARFIDALVEARMRKAERDIARYRFLLPDQFEREALKRGLESDRLPFVR
jgi:hypothetical protein